MSTNSVTLIGNLTRDPELRFTTGGRGVASFGLAVNRRYQQNGEWQEQTSFFNVVRWGDLGENAATSLTKGSRVDRHRPPRAAQLGDPGGREALGRRGRSPTRSARACAGRTAQIERTERTGGDGGFSAAAAAARRCRAAPAPVPATRSDLRRRRAVLNHRRSRPGRTNRWPKQRKQDPSRARVARTPNPRKYKKKTSPLVIDKVEYVDYKDVDLLSRFMSDRAKIRNMRVSGNDRPAAARHRQRDQDRPRDGVAAVRQARRLGAAARVRRATAIAARAATRASTSHVEGVEPVADADRRRRRRASTTSTTRRRTTRRPDMQVILRSDLDGLGKRGDIVDVSDGHARNYLLPKGLALKATPVRRSGGQDAPRPRPARRQRPRRGRHDRQHARAQGDHDHGQGRRRGQAVRLGHHRRHRRRRRGADRHQARPQVVHLDDADQVARRAHRDGVAAPATCRSRSASTSSPP